MSSRVRDDAVRLVFDGVCPACTAATAWLGASGLLRPGEACAFEALEPAEAERLLELGVRTDVVLLGPEPGGHATGVAALAILLRRAGLGRRARLLETPPILQAARVLYRVVARHRRLLAPPAPGGRIPCACDPPEPGLRDRLDFAMLGPLAVTLAVGVRVVGARSSSRSSLRLRLGR